MRAFVYPGQGSQYIGMGYDLYQAFASAREVFQEVDETLSYNLSQLIFKGDEATLKMTENAQPALMAVSIAISATLEKEFGIEIDKTVSYVAGHSLGEYTAYCATKVLNLAQTAKLLKIRGQSMQAASPNQTGGMAALLGVTLELAQEIADDVSSTGHICQVANDNAPGQIVISGHLSALDRALIVAKDKGAKRAILLPVSAPFHCSLMQPAVERMQEALADIMITQLPIVSLISNVTATPVEHIDQIKPRLLEQITGRVRWTETIAAMRAAGVKEIVEIGAGKVLSGLNKRIEPGLVTMNVERPEELEAFAQLLSA